MRERPHFTLGVVLPNADNVLDATNQSVFEYHRGRGIYFHKIVREVDSIGGHPMGIRSSTRVYADDDMLPLDAVIEDEYAVGERVGIGPNGLNGYHTHGDADGSINKIPVVYRQDI
jgi:hypothetical protein